MKAKEQAAKINNAKKFLKQFHALQGDNLKDFLEENMGQQMAVFFQNYCDALLQSSPSSSLEHIKEMLPTVMTLGFLIRDDLENIKQP